MKGKTVWIITYAQGQGNNEVDRVFSSEEKANEYRDSQRFPGNYGIEELEVE